MVTLNRSSQSLGEERREFLATGYLRTEPVVLSTVFRWAFSQHRRRNCADVLRCDPTHSIRAPEHRKAVITDLHELRDLLHEHVWMDVRPRDAACLDIGFDQLVPNDMWICAIPMAEYSKVHNVLDASFSGSINEGLALGQHRQCVAGKQEYTVHPVERGSKSNRTVEIQKNSVLALLLKCCDLFRPARSHPNMNCVWLPIQVLKDKPPNLAGGAQDQNGGLFEHRHVCSLLVLFAILSMMVCPVLNQLHQHFPDVFTGKEFEESSRGPFNSNFYCLSVRNVAIANPSVHLLDEFRSATEVIGDKETFQKKPLLDCHQQVRRSTHSLVIARDHSAERKPCERLGRCQSRIQVVSSDIVEICIDAARRDLSQRFR